MVCFIFSTRTNWRKQNLLMINTKDMELIGFFMCSMFLLIICVGAIILGEWIRGKNPNSGFSRWWDRNVIARIDDRFDI